MYDFDSWSFFFLTSDMHWLTHVRPHVVNMTLLISFAFFIVMANNFHHQDKATRLLRLASCFSLANLWSAHVTEH